MELRSKTTVSASSSSSSSTKLPKRRVKKKDEKKQNGESMNAWNPLFMFETLSLIFNYLTVANLKECRQVCKFWGFEGGKILLKKSSVKLDCVSMETEETDPSLKVEERTKKKEQLENFLNTKGDSSGFNSAIPDMDYPDTLKSTPTLLLQHTTCLFLNPLYYPNSNTALVKYLDFFPKLQILRLGNGWRVLEDFPAEVKMSLLNKFKSLKEIRLESREWPPYNLMKLLLTKNDLAVKEIHLQNNASLFFGKYLESGCTWPIDTLVLEIGLQDLEILNNVRAFLFKISGSLKHLKWTFTSTVNVSADHVVPWANNLMSPSILNGLETLEIKAWSQNFHAWPLLAVALQLPNLKKLSVQGKIPENLEERIGVWNRHPNAKGRTLKSESVEELEFINNEEEIPVESMTIFSKRLWPNLKSLRIENPPNNLSISFSLSEWIRLERLDLKFQKLCQEYAFLWNEWFTGRERSNSKDANFSLKDLKDLKHLGIWENEYDHSTRIATDFLVKSSLKFMTQLQSLHLENSEISCEVKEMLKKALGPNVNVQYL